MKACIPFVHKWQLIDTHSRCSWSDKGGITISFYKCSRCGKRKSSSTNNGYRHVLAGLYEELWKVNGVLPEPEHTQASRTRKSLETVPFSNL